MRAVTIFMLSPRFTALLVPCLVAALIGSAFAEPEAPVSFRKDIAPLLQRRCSACHCEDSAKGNYRLDNFPSLGA